MGFDFERMTNRAILRAAVQRSITCVLSGKVLDIRRAVLAEIYQRSGGAQQPVSLVFDAETFDATYGGGKLDEIAARHNATVTIFDGRELFARRRAVAE